MPYISESIKLPEEYDRRRKLSEAQKGEIREMYATGQYSLQKLADAYGVSKKLILITVNPESKRKSDERMREHWRDYVQSRKERAAAVKNHRRYKQKLYEEGKIKPDEERG